MKLSSHRLKLLMAERIITISELAFKAGLSRNFISNCINGKANPKPATIGKIARALNVPISEIIENAGGTDKSE